MLNICTYMCNFQWSKNALKEQHSYCKQKLKHVLDMQISIYHMTDHLNIKWACMNRVVHLIQNTCIKVIVS
jgi:hypothetical protein